MSETEAVEYQALYQRYRPMLFKQLIGQHDVAESLRIAVAEDRVNHAYLFLGQRGCGKTSSARILARAVNCENPDNGEPCNVCDSCVDITNGSSMSVEEHDAGSSSGVDAMREILSKVGFVVPGKKKVIIIDEAHLLSKSASSALLLTLETPPKGVIFILCSTEGNGILPTIVSRCQQRTFRLVQPDIMKNFLARISTHAKLNVSEEQITQAVLAGGGSVRDSISYLEAIADVGDMQTSWEHQVVEALATVDAMKILSSVALATQGGAAPRDLAEGMFVVLRECFFVEMKATALLTTPDWGKREETAHALGAKKITQAIAQLGEAIKGMQQGGDGRANLEIALMRYCALSQ
jgi:DNA polymerase-3 subunit gamma/tau